MKKKNKRNSSKISLRAVFIYSNFVYCDSILDIVLPQSFTLYTLPFVQVGQSFIFAVQEVGK